MAFYLFPKKISILLICQWSFKLLVLVCLAIKVKKWQRGMTKMICVFVYFVFSIFDLRRFLSCGIFSVTMCNFYFTYFGSVPISLLPSLLCWMSLMTVLHIVVLTIVLLMDNLLFSKKKKRELIYPEWFSS